MDRCPSWHANALSNYLFTLIDARDVVYVVTFEEISYTEDDEQARSVTGDHF